MSNILLTLDEYFTDSAVYWGHNGHYLVLATVHRDSSILDECNFTQLCRELHHRDLDYTVERANHWLVGWIDYLIINPENTETVAYAYEVSQALADYPILCEHNYSEALHNAADDYWQQLDPWERLDYLKDNRHYIETYNFKDLRQVIKGEYCPLDSSCFDIY